MKADDLDFLIGLGEPLDAVNARHVLKELRSARKVLGELEAMIRRSTIIGLNPGFWQALSAHNAEFPEDE